tara:strand:+ start:238 stop:360 length:123 start_codon:yes stop_codon:yes gene_type:complete
MQQLSELGKFWFFGGLVAPIAKPVMLDKLQSSLQDWMIAN